MGCKWVGIDCEFFAKQFLAQGDVVGFIVREGIPENAKLLRTWVHSTPTGRQEIRFLFSSEDWAEGREGDEHERISLEFEDYHP